MSKILLIPAALLGLASCTTAATLGDEAIRKATFERVQATPFNDALSVDTCRKSLTASFGFRHESLEVINGVQISQTYKCRGPRILAEVNLKNRNPYPMYCAALSDGTETGAWVGPNGLAFYEYAFVNGVSQDCFQ